MGDGVCSGQHIAHLGVSNRIQYAFHDLRAGSFGSACHSVLPLYLLQKEKKGNGEAYKFASNILTLTIVLLGILALACSVFSPLVIETQTFTVGQGELEDPRIFFFRIFAIQILFYGVGAVITGILNAERTYLMPSLAPVMNNIVVTVVMFGFVPLSSWNEEFALCAGYRHLAGRVVPVRHSDPCIGEAGFPHIILTSICVIP